MASPGRVLGLDLGDVRIGVAISDPDRLLAVPFGTVYVGRPPGELRAIADIAREHDVALIVLGEPVSMDGTRGTRAEHAAAFATALASATDAPIVLQDERLSTVEAERNLRSVGVRGQNQRRVVDAAAAQIILQAWLDAQPGSHADPAWD